MKMEEVTGGTGLGLSVSVILPQVLRLGMVGDMRNR
jgi:hypothetical protein